jgi:hypothetical protein
MAGFWLRRVISGGGAALAGLLMSVAAADAGACDAKKAQSLIGRSYSPRLEEKALALSGASTAAPVGLGFASTADYRTDRVDIWLDGKGDVKAFSCG